MNETLFACIWIMGGWIAGLCTAPREGWRDAPVSSLLAILVIGAHVGPFIVAPAGWRLARGAVASRGNQRRSPTLCLAEVVREG